MLPYVEGVLLEVVPECSRRFKFPSRCRWLGVQSQAEGPGAPILGTRTHLLVLAMQPMRVLSRAATCCAGVGGPGADLT
jgi:hypothetical protein